MQEIVKNIGEIKAGLFSGNISVVCETLEYVREMSNFQSIDILLDLYVTTQNVEVKRKVFDLLVDVKDASFIDAMVNCLQKPKYSAFIAEMVSICWQTGLDFSKYSGFFLDLLLSGTFETSLECMTVIEESLHSISEPMRLQLAGRIDISYDNMSEEKKSLLNELRKMLA